MINTDRTIFELLTKYHIKRNLVAGLAKEEGADGRMYFNEKDGERVQVQIGEENGQRWYKGLFLLSNGSDIIDFLQRKGIIQDSVPVSMDLRQEDGFFEFIDAMGRRDNAFVYDQDAKQTTRVRVKSENRRPSLKKGITVESMLPNDFLSEDGSYSLIDGNGDSNVGTRSATAVEVSGGFYGKRKSFLGKREYHPVDAFLIKHTIFNSLGFGPVVHITRDSMEMFFFRHAPDMKGPFINEEYKIAGVYRAYELSDGKFSKIGEDRIVHLDNGGRLAYATGELVFPDKNLSNSFNYRANGDMSISEKPLTELLAHL